MMASYKFIDHTADVLFQAEAATVDELFEQCALAVEETQVHLDKVDANQTITITGENKSIESLLFDFLDDLVYYKDADQLVFSKFKATVSEEHGLFKLSCVCQGEILNVEKHQPKVDVKAITMHMFEVKKVDHGWVAQVLVDI
jgi:SHS2 domain-containing protein